MSDTPSPPLNKIPSLSTLPWFTIATALIVLVFFGYMTNIMFIDRVAEKEQMLWDRSLAIYSGIEAFALSAAGVLLGTQIQNGRVRSAEQRADQKQTEATNATADKQQAVNDLDSVKAKATQALDHLDGVQTMLSAQTSSDPSVGSKMTSLRSVLKDIAAQ